MVCPRSHPASPHTRRLSGGFALARGAFPGDDPPDPRVARSPRVVLGVGPVLWWVVVGWVALARGATFTVRYLHCLSFTSSASPGSTRAQKIISGDFQDRRQVPLEDHVAPVAEMFGPAPAAGSQSSRAVVRVRHLGVARYGIRRLNRR